MRIAYISYEHPLGISGGGIGTYLGQIARVMATRGHDVEVFTGHADLSDTFRHEGYTIHRIATASVTDFREKVVESFANVHTTSPFDIIESAEYGADAYLVRNRFRQVPLAVKLHTPSFLLGRLNGKPFKSRFGKFIFLLKCLRRGIIKKPFWVYDKKSDPEFGLFRMANGLYSPSNSLGGIVGKEWGRQPEISVVPNPFVPSRELLAIPTVKKPDNKTVICFIGKLEVRKGVDILMKAIPSILQRCEHVAFRFIGEPLPSPQYGLNMQEYILKELANFSHHLEFLGKQPAHQIPKLLTDVHLCVFPSRWENFPNVCLESMAAGKVVIGTNNGGMADIIEHAENGLLVAPDSPQELAQRIIEVINEEYDIEAIGIAARARILSAYNSERIGKMTEDFYREIIRKHTAVSLPAM